MVCVLKKNQKKFVCRPCSNFFRFCHRAAHRHIGTATIRACMAAHRHMIDTKFQILGVLDITAHPELQKIRINLFRSTIIIKKYQKPFIMDASSEQQPQQQQQQQQSQQQMPMPPTNPQVAARRPNNNNNNNNNNYNYNNDNNNQSRGRGGRGDGGRRTGGNGGRGGGRGGRSPTPPSGRGGNNNNFVANKIAPSTGVPFGHVPAYLPGSSSLVEELDQRIMIVLRDGRHLVGTLRSFDQYSNMVLDNASERRFHNQSNKNITYFTDVPLGMYIVRGDSVVLLGQVGSEEEEENNNAVGNNGVSQQHTAMIVSMKRLHLDEFEAMVAASEDDDKAVAEEEVAGEDESKSLEWDFDKDLLA